MYFVYKSSGGKYKLEQAENIKTSKHTDKTMKLRINRVGSVPSLQALIAPGQAKMTGNGVGLFGHMGKLAGSHGPHGDQRQPRAKSRQK